MIQPTKQGDAAAISLAAAMDSIAGAPFYWHKAQEQAQRFTVQLAWRRYPAPMGSCARE